MRGKQYGTWVMRMTNSHDSCLTAMSQQWLMSFSFILMSKEWQKSLLRWDMSHTRNDSRVCDMTPLFVTWLIHVWHDCFSCVSGCVWYAMRHDLYLTWLTLQNSSVLLCVCIFVMMHSSVTWCVWCYSCLLHKNPSVLLCVCILVMMHSSVTWCVEWHTCWLHKNPSIWLRVCFFCVCVSIFLFLGGWCVVCCRKSGEVEGWQWRLCLMSWSIWR